MGLEVFAVTGTDFPADFAAGIFTAGIFTAGIFTAGIFTAGIFTAGIFAAGDFAAGDFAAGDFAIAFGAALGAVVFGAGLVDFTEAGAPFDFKFFDEEGFAVLELSMVAFFFSGEALFTTLTFPLDTDFAVVLAFFAAGTGCFDLTDLLAATDFPDVFGIGFAAFFLVGADLLGVAAGFFEDFKVIAPWQNTEPLLPRRSVRNGFV